MRIKNLTIVYVCGKIGIEKIQDHHNKPKFPQPQMSTDVHRLYQRR